MPWRKTWPELLTKRIIRYAADHGYDGVSWTPGEEQASRYDLSKQVDAIRANKNPDGTYQIGIKPIGENMQKYKTDVPADKLADHVGKDLANKIISEVTDTGIDGGKVFSGIDLKVGGEGMKGFYDEMIPSIANKIVKLFGGKVGETFISLPDPETYEGNSMPSEKAINDGGYRVPYIQITPQMRDVIKKVPFSLFTILATVMGLNQKAKANDKNTPESKQNFQSLLAEAKARRPVQH